MGACLFVPPVAKERGAGRSVLGLTGARQNVLSEVPRGVRAVPRSDLASRRGRIYWVYWVYCGPTYLLLLGRGGGG
jgi:hypothetical protein